MAGNEDYKPKTGIPIAIPPGDARRRSMFNLTAGTPRVPYSVGEGGPPRVALLPDPQPPPVVTTQPAALDGQPTTTSQPNHQPKMDDQNASLNQQNPPVPSKPEAGAESGPSQKEKTDESVSQEENANVGSSSDSSLVTWYAGPAPGGTWVVSVAENESSFLLLELSSTGMVRAQFSQKNFVLSGEGDVRVIKGRDGKDLSTVRKVQ